MGGRAVNVRRSQQQADSDNLALWTHIDKVSVETLSISRYLFVGSEQSIDKVSAGTLSIWSSENKELKRNRHNNHGDFSRSTKSPRGLCRC